MPTVLPHALVKKFKAVVDAALRRPLVASTLADLDETSLSLFLLHLLAGLDSPDLRSLYLDTVLALVCAGQEMDPGRRYALFRRLCEDPMAPVFVFLSQATTEPRRSGIVREEPYEFDDEALGVRKSFARGRDRDRLKILSADPDPGVIEILLENPLSTEDECLKAASLRPQSSEVFPVVLRSRFGVRERVQAAIALNPFCPLKLAAALVPLLSHGHVEEVARGSMLDPRLRAAADAVLEAWRRNIGR